MAAMLICLLMTMLMPMLAKAPVAVAMNRLDGYDNRYPRDQQAKLEGFGARALAAHQNCFEALTYFTPAAVAVMALGAIDNTAIWLSVLFVVCRVFYVIMYWMDLDKLRSIFWIIGFGCSIALVVRLLLAFG